MTDLWLCAHFGSTQPTKGWVGEQLLLSWEDVPHSCCHIRVKGGTLDHRFPKSQNYEEEKVMQHKGFGIPWRGILISTQACSTCSSMTPCDRYTLAHAQTAWGFCNLNMFFSSEQKKVDEILIFSPKNGSIWVLGEIFFYWDSYLKKKNGTIEEETGRGQLSSTLASSRNGKRLEAKPYK